ncbi:MAG TPA: SAM-dependent methyltransferase [Acidimicrobiales bacterium]|nr:SAM-dependent methyltransferase [Acidimicrobiales bacterium]
MTGTSATPSGPKGDPLVDTSVAHPARVYDYLLGGTVNFAVDREAAVHATAAIGGVDVAKAIVRANRDFLGVIVRYLAAEVGIRQFLDIGTGIPTGDNVHEVAQRAVPEARIVYVDYDPIVLAHAHQLLESTPEGATAYVHGDLRDPEPILAQAAATLDFGEPIALVLIGVLHFIRDTEDPYGIVARLMEAMPSGSYLAISHLAGDVQATEMAEMAERYDDSVDEAMIVRSHAEVSRFFDGLELVGPGVVTIDRWEASATDTDPPEGWVMPVYGAVGRKP